jgi:autotransporter-associated beta strand protein
MNSDAVATSDLIVWTRRGPSLFEGTLEGKIRLSKTDPGSLELTGANTYTEGTKVWSGVLLVNNGVGSGTGTGIVEVLDGATLAGVGWIAGAVGIEDGGAISPGDGGPGSLTVGSLRLNNASEVHFALGQPNVVGGPSNDIVYIDGDPDNNNLTLDGKLFVTPGANFGPGRYRLFTYVGDMLTNNTLEVDPTVGGTIDATVQGRVDLVIPAGVGLPALSEVGLGVLAAVVLMGGAFALRRFEFA